MILTSIHEIRRAMPKEYDGFAVVRLETAQGDLSIHLPQGTSDAVAAAINVALKVGVAA